MKKSLFVIFFAALTAIAAYAQNGEITDLTGTVELKPAGASQFTPAKKGDTVGANTVVSTGFKSSAVITVGSATIIARPLTRLTLTEITKMQDKETINVGLQGGRVRVDVNPPSGTKTDFRITSPTATASVRGTSFELDTHNLYVLKGTVVYTGEAGAPVPVQAGFNTEIDTTAKRVADPITIHLSELLPPPPIGGPPGGGGPMTGSTAPSVVSGEVIAPGPGSGTGTGSAAPTEDFGFSVIIMP